MKMKERFDIEQQERAVLKNDLFRPSNRNRYKVRYAYMDGVDFDHEVGEAAGGNTVYATPEDLLKYQSCATGCGIYRVRITKEKEILPQEFLSRDSISSDDIDNKTPKYLAWKKRDVRHWKERLGLYERRVALLKNLIKQGEKEMADWDKPVKPVKKGKKK